MLRIYFLQQWFNLSDPAVEEALYDSSAMRRFVDIDLGREPVPDETTVCRFRHLLEAHDLGQPFGPSVAARAAIVGKIRGDSFEIQESQRVFTDRANSSRSGRERM